MFLWALPQARSSHRLEGSNEPPFVRQVLFFSCSLYERALSCHHTTSLQLKQSLKNLVERDCQRVCTKAVRWASPRPRLRWVYKKVRSRWNQHSSSSSIAQHAVCHSCKVLQSTMKRMKESDMDGQTKLFSFGFSRGRSGNQPEPNGLTLLLLVHLSSFESFVLERVDKQSARRRTTLSKSISSWVRHTALTCKERCGRGRFRFRQARTSEERKRSYRQELRLPEAHSERLAATVQGKMARREMAYVLRMGGRRFLCTMRSLS